MFTQDMMPVAQCRIHEVLDTWWFDHIAPAVSSTCAKVTQQAGSNNGTSWMVMMWRAWFKFVG